jgi:DNA-binding CsgD family transcriptional regulator
MAAFLLLQVLEKRNPGQQPALSNMPVQTPFLDVIMRCCDCRKITTSGIYERIDPEMMPRKGSHMSISEIAGRYNLSARELEAVEFLLSGLTSKEIADRMKISPNTVKATLRVVMIKMGVSTRSGIVGKIIQPFNRDANPDERKMNEINHAWLRDAIFWSVTVLIVFLLYLVVMHSQF